MRLSTQKVRFSTHGNPKNVRFYTEQIIFSTDTTEICHQKKYYLPEKWDFQFWGTPKNNIFPPTKWDYQTKYMIFHHRICDFSAPRNPNKWDAPPKKEYIQHKSYFPPKNWNAPIQGTQTSQIFHQQIVFHQTNEISHQKHEIFHQTNGITH